ncbi:MAG TPA: hypothetical protein VMI10_26275 [Terriglobales bacterium]|nr:hypothetical protein [Terriglobales bacterium]
MFVEILLNLCWLALVLPAFALWRQRALSDRSARRSVLFLCALGCVLVLLFPVISASDDLHASSFAMEESRRSLRHAHTASNADCVDHCPQIAVLVSNASPLAVRHVGFVPLFSSHSHDTQLFARVVGRAPPV